MRPCSLRLNGSCAADTANHTGTTAAVMRTPAIASNARGLMSTAPELNWSESSELKEKIKAIKPVTSSAGRAELIDAAHASCCARTLRIQTPQTTVSNAVSTSRITLLFSHVAVTKGVNQAQPNNTTPIRKAAIAPRRHLA